jgi:hypothetical protein
MLEDTIIYTTASAILFGIRVQTNLPSVAEGMARAGKNVEHYNFDAGAAPI